jgi:enoyl-CoA hydratase/carnithine racemase
MGMISEAVPADLLLDRATGLATSLAQGASVALGMTKSLVDRAWETTLEQLASLEGYTAAVSRSTHDHREALDAVREKRTGAFLGR